MFVARAGVTWVGLASHALEIHTALAVRMTMFNSSLVHQLYSMRQKAGEETGNEASCTILVMYLCDEEQQSCK